MDLVGLEVRLTRNDGEMAAAFELRRQVFVVEQRVPAEIERDEHDANATHVVAMDGAVMLATGRLVATSLATARIGRMAVAAHARRRGIGSQVLRCLEEQAHALGFQRVLLHAQLGVLGFYEAHGYVAEGPEFLEADIAHVAMTKQL